VRTLINWGRWREVWGMLARGIPLGEPTVLLATLAAIFLAFMPVSPSPNNSPSLGGQRNGAASATQLFPWENYPVVMQTSQPAESPLFPFSIIPGGARSAEELKNAIANDPVVAEHYAEFDLEKTHTVRAESSRLVYVSYRMGNSVFWTKKPLKIAEGETLITDGQHEARTRCGNRLSETPVAPVSAEEPPEEAMERAQDSDLLAINSPPPEMPLSPPPATDIPPSSTHRIFIPPIFPIWWGAGTPPGGIPVTPPPVATPEPETYLLLSMGLSALWLLRKKRKS
jgi:hypothetical protein